MSLRLTEKQPLIVRPVVTIVNSVPHLDQSGQDDRTAGFGDTVLAFALPHSFVGGRLTVGAGPTLIFPTASTDVLRQDAWQMGPDAGGVLLGRHFITYGSVQHAGDAHHPRADQEDTFLIIPTVSLSWRTSCHTSPPSSISRTHRGRASCCGGSPTGLRPRGITIVPLLAAFAYLTSAPAAVENVRHVGYPQQLRILLGVPQLAGAIVLLRPSSS
jgi:hypothetical protein